MYLVKLYIKGAKKFLNLSIFHKKNNHVLCNFAHNISSLFRYIHTYFRCLIQNAFLSSISGNPSHFISHQHTSAHYCCVRCRTDNVYESLHSWSKYSIKIFKLQREPSHLMYSYILLPLQLNKVTSLSYPKRAS